MSLEGNIESNQAYQDLRGKITLIAIDKTLTKTGHCADAKTTGDELALRVKYADIVDNLTSESANKPLSAKQGQILKRQIDDVDPHYANNVIYNNEDSGLNATDVQGAINELENEIDKIFLVEKITASTDSGGCLLTNIPYYYIPVSAIVTSHTHRECTFFTANNYHYIHIRDAIGSSNIADTEVTIKVYYINPDIMSHSNQ